MPPSPCHTHYLLHSQRCRHTGLRATTYALAVPRCATTGSPSYAATTVGSIPARNHHRAFLVFRTGSRLPPNAVASSSCYYPAGSWITTVERVPAACSRCTTTVYFYMLLFPHTLQLACRLPGSCYYLLIFPVSLCTLAVVLCIVPQPFGSAVAG